MKFLLMGIWALLLSLQVEAELNVKKIETMVTKIQSKRISRLDIDFTKVPSPFIVIVPKDENHTAVQIQSPERMVAFSLSAIINGEAYIDGRWVKEGDTIAGYSVKSVKPGEVLLEKNQREIRLFLPEPKKEEHLLLQMSEG